MGDIEFRVKGIAPETRTAINKLAKQSKLTVAQYLDLTFSGIKPKDPPNYQWHIARIDPDVKDRIRTKAALRNMSIGQYLEYLINKEDPKENKLVADIINHLDSARGLIDNLS